MLYDPHLELFLKVAEVLSFTKAGEEFFISPSAVIKQINLLENNLAVRLFERSYHGLKLTKAGEILKEKAPELIELSTAIELELKETENKAEKIIRIGTSPLTKAETVAELWPKIFKCNNDYKFQIVPFENNENNAQTILANLGNKIDVIAGLYDDLLLKRRNCNGFKLKDEKLAIAMSINHPLAFKDRLKLEDLNNQELMILEKGNMQTMDDLRIMLKKDYPAVKIIDFPVYETSIFNDCENNNRLVIAFDLWKNIHPLLKTVDIDWKYQMNYGFLHSLKPAKIVNDFLSSLKEII